MKTWKLIFLIFFFSSCSYQPLSLFERRQDYCIINKNGFVLGNIPIYRVGGEQFIVRQSSRGYSETGIASWYGPNFHGQRTSSGEIYDMNELTAAHKTLPIPSWVRVTNLDNDSSVLVRINDRGPFVDDRIIDLSREAAERIDMIRDGTARVRVESQADWLGRYTDLNVDYYAQVGTFENAGNARSMVINLRNQNFNNVMIESVNSGANTQYLVKLGPFSQPEAFIDLESRLTRSGYEGSCLVAE